MTVQSPNRFGPSGASKFHQEFGAPTVAVTGAAGFIGSHLVERLLQLGCSVIGVDDFDPWYDQNQKRNNLRGIVQNPNFELVDEALNHEIACAVFGRSSVVFHLAGRPGVQDSWGHGFIESSRRNVELTQQVFEASVECDVSRVVYASSSSVYGSGATGLQIAPEPQPISPYGVSKLVGEQLAHVYRNQGLEVTNLRFFTVYGPRQRPDMAMHRMFESTKPGGPVFVRRGDGLQRREFTYVSDVVSATVAAGFVAAAADETFDVGGGSSVSLQEVMSMVEKLAGASMRTETTSAPAGDPAITVARTSRTSAVLGWNPEVDLLEGLREQWEWHRYRASSEAPLLIAD